MLLKEDLEKEKITIKQYGDLVTDCGWSAIGTGIATSLLGLVAIPASLTYLDKFVVSRFEIKACSSVVGALVICLYTIKHARQNCEKGIHEKYDI